MSPLLQEILDHNRAYAAEQAESRRAEAARLEKTPRRRCAIFTCMDGRLVEMVEPALGIRRGDAVVLRNAGNIIGTLQGTMIISLLVAVFMQDIREIIVVGHEDCGFTHASSVTLLEKMRGRGIPEDAVEAMRGPLETYLDPHTDPEQNVRDVAELLRTHPAFPRDLAVHGLLMHPADGTVRLVVDGTLCRDTAAAAQGGAF